VHEVK